MTRVLPALDLVSAAMAYDPSTGAITWLHRADVPSCINGRYVGKEAGKIDFYGYRVVRFNKQTYFAHRIAHLFMTGKWPEDQIDHIDGNPLNNSWLNLRQATQSENMRNRAGFGKSGYKGVCYISKTRKWRAQIHIAGKQCYLGSFETAELAGAAYIERASEVHGDFAYHKCQEARP